MGSVTRLEFLGAFKPNQTPLIKHHGKRARHYNRSLRRLCLWLDSVVAHDPFLAIRLPLLTPIHSGVESE